MKKAFITGISGQDGSYLSEHLVSLGYEVHGIVRRNSVPEHQDTRIDSLVELGVFKSRSEAVAAYVEKSILPHIELYERIKNQAKKVGILREEAMELITETFDE